MDKPSLIVVAESIHPHLGSEPGKGWWWSCALSSFYRLHIITTPAAAGLCRDEERPRRDGWTFHHPGTRIDNWAFPRGYIQYGRWLAEALAIARNIKDSEHVVGLCHVNIGSFRVLPRYDLLGIPYTLGPLGGGECSPVRLLLSRKAPFSHKCSELARPILNNSFALSPSLRKTMNGASMVLATSLETESVLRRMGARHTQVVFPDAYDQVVDFDGILAVRKTQVEELPECIRLLWQGRPLWWKAPDLALSVLKSALDRGVRVRLTMICDWRSKVGIATRSMAENLGISSHVEFLGFVSRDELFRLAKDQHAFLATSMHDSGGIPLIEAQAQGLPCITLALGGNRDAVCPDGGVSGAFPSTREFMKATVDRLTKWQGVPQTWLKDSESSLRFSKTFGIQRIQEQVRDQIAPCFPG